MYGTKPGLTCCRARSWDGEVPAGHRGVFRFDTRIAVVVIPRVFMDDTAADRAAVQPVVNQSMMYPLAEYAGDDADARLDAGARRSRPAMHRRRAGTQWVVPEQFFDELPAVLEEVPAAPGEEALYALAGLAAAAAAADRSWPAG